MSGILMVNTATNMDMQHTKTRKFKFLCDAALKVYTNLGENKTIMFGFRNKHESERRKQLYWSIKELENSEDFII